MSGILDTYFAVDFAAGAEQRLGFGSLKTRLGRVVTPGGHWSFVVRTLEPEGVAVLWDYAGRRDFELVAARIVGSGYLWLAYLVDTPVSAEDLSPSGLHPRWRHVDLGCHAPWILSSDQAQLDTASAAADVGASGDLPALWTSGTHQTGKVYRVAAYNPSETDGVTIETVVVG